MAETTHVIRYLSNINDVKSKTKEIERINQILSNKFGKDFARATDIVNQSLDRISERTIITKDGGKAIEQIQQYSTVVKDANGNLKTVVETQKRVDGALKSSTVSLKDGGKATRSFANNIQTLARRALLTIPVWFALRQALSSIIKFFRDTSTNLIEFDRALQKLKRNLQGTPEEISKNFEKARQVITQFSIETGKSTEEITRAIQRFATVGFDFETSLSAGLDATRLAILLFGDAEDTANAFARALRVLVTNIDDAELTQREISEALALTSELWETNAFEIGELNQGLEKFAGTAKSLNLTIDETIVLLSALSTRGLNANRSGRLLRTSFQKLEQNLGKVARVLGLEVNPEVDRTFDVFVKVTNAIAKLRNESGKISPEVTSAITEIFGGSRNGEPIRDIIADVTKINETFQKFIGVRPDIQGFQDDVNQLNKSLFRQVEILQNLGKEAGKAFLEGLVDIRALNEFLINVNEAGPQIVKDARFLGELFRKTLNGTLTNPIGASRYFLTKFSDLAFEQLFDKAKINKASKDFVQEINRAIRGKLSKAELNILLKDFEIKIQKANLDLGPGTIEQLKTEFEKQIEGNEPTLKIQPTIDTKAGLFFATQQEFAEAIVKDQLERLQLIGATNSELIRAEQILREQFNIQEDSLKAVERQLELERAISQERRLQSRLSSETITLFRIAQQEGIDVARSIGRALSGELDFSMFVRRGGRALEVFQQQFSDLFEQQQALAFFTGQRIPGFTESLFGGTTIPIQEEAIRRTPRVTPLNADVQIRSNLEVNVSGLDFNQAVNKLKRSLIREIENPNSELGQKLDQRILGL